MSARDPMSESLAALLDDAVVELELVATRAQPDLADILARAQRLAPTRSLANLVEDVRRLDGLRADQIEDIARIGDLDALIESARIDHARFAAQADTVPPLRHRVPQRSARGTTWALVFCVAALLVAALSLGWGLRGHTLDRTASREYSGANKTADADDWSQAHIDDLPRRRAPAPVPALAPAPLETVAKAPTPSVGPSLMPRTRGPSTTERLVAIDRNARAAWRRGDLAAAENAFEDLVRTGGRRSLVDLAYGDLFELARQRHEPAREARLWQQYLRRFPNGRFADEARAGLCRRATGAQANLCWQRYLDERPHGTYRAHARAALDSGTTALK